MPQDYVDEVDVDFVDEPDEAVVGTAPANFQFLPLQRPGETIRPPKGPVRAAAPERGMLATAASGLNPMTPEGRRNVAGGVGAIGGAILAAPTAAVAGPAGPATGALLGSMVGGMLVEGGEQLVGTSPKDIGRLGAVGAEQGLYEMTGQAALWPIKAAGRRMLASGVAKRASEHLAGTRTAIEEQLETALTAAQQGVRRARTRVVEGVSGARQAAAEGLRRVRGEAREGVEAAKTFASDLTAPLTAKYDELVATPPARAADVGRRAQAVIAGPAKSARDMAGERVEEAARTGPPVNIAALKAEATRILEREIRPPQTAFPRQPAVDASGEALAAAGISPEMAERMIAGGGPNASALQEALAAAQAETEQTVLKHPALGVLQRILNAGDEVSFADAHQFKRELDDAIGTAWDQSIKKRVTSITQHLRGTLRTALTGHAPYDQATAAYQQIAPLYTKGIAPKLKKLAADSPEAIVRMIRGDEPTRARMLKELLTTQAAEGGDAAGGLEAWNAVRATWTHAKVIRGGIDTISERIGKLDPEFKDIFYGDQTGRAVLTNLQAIETAYKSALERGMQEIAEAKSSGRAAVDTMRETGRQGIEAVRQAGSRATSDAMDTAASVRAARTAARQPTAAETRFKASSLGKAQDATQTAADLLRAGALGPGSIWGGISLLRVLKGPKAADLVEWAAYSPKHTQLLVQALTSPAPGMAAADLLRSTGIFDDSFIQKLEKDGAGPAAQVGEPPPQF